MNLNINLNLSANNKIDNEFINKFIKELGETLKKMTKEGGKMTDKSTELDEYNLYEKKKIFLDNKSRNGNDLAWIMDDNSVCISEGGDGGPVSINEISLPENKRIGQVYEKIDGEYVYNEEITMEIDKIQIDRV